LGKTSTYDYVIIGAGSAGSVIAARLSQDPHTRVALVEAGGPDIADEIRVPVAFGQLFKSRYDWDFASEPEPGLSGRTAYLPRARTLGGCSSMNAMIYMRGNRVDFDDWAADGATGWSYTDVLPLFKRAENNERGASRFHGVHGPLSVSDSHSNHPIADALVQAAMEAGQEYNPDFNAEQQEGFGRFQVTQRNGLRCSTAVGYLAPNVHRSNLTVLTHALALRIVFDGNRAVGVEIERNGEVELLGAEREVIVSAGAYQSPQLLMLSGIGPADHLRQLRIDVRQDLAVGQGLQDHLMVLANWLTDIETLESALTPANLEQLIMHGRGPLSSNVPEMGGFVRTRPGLRAPDVQFHGAMVLFYEGGLGIPVDHGFSFGPCVLKPTSRGQVTLRTPRPDSKVRIFHNYLATDEDRDSILAGMQLMVEIAAQPAFRALVRAPFLIPTSDSESDLLEFVRQCGQTLYHPTSTCAIGSVVDPNLKVFGIEGLRVADASVMPSIVRGNTNAATIMIGEKAADLIRDRQVTPSELEPAGVCAVDRAGRAYAGASS
jgi:choline dehydrogenase-like flavoprotein